MNEGAITGAFPAHEGLTALVGAPPGTDATGIPPGGSVVAWVLVADEVVAGGARLDPVFLAAGRAWTVDQYRRAYGQELDVRVGQVQ
ncbi:hypothetical protein AB0C91_09990 [Streptomyces sp. NPDC048674]|uniref:hypothetical protein n=1 Tax=Streptomyces sp. NPDC048674 TaxID=3155491 RepID=UPI00341C984F